VDAAHSFGRGGSPWPLRVVLDAVINHSGDNWSYPGDYTYRYWNDQQFPFGGWRFPDRPIPTELRDPDWYHRRGQIQNYDEPLQAQQGDIASLKDYANDDDAVGSAVVNTLIRAHCNWIREADVDGFRVDAVKHLAPLACSWFASSVREYAYSLGKRGFFLFGEVASPDDDLIDRYLGQNTSAGDPGQTVFFGLDSALDFRLAEGRGGDAGLRYVLKGEAPPQALFDRLEAQRERALNRGEIGRYLVTFVDNHDSFWQPGCRIANGADDAQVIAALGYLLCALGTACIYYGTEQGFAGAGGDNEMREACFGAADAGVNLLNTDCAIYSAISQIAAVVQASEPLRFGRMYFRQIAADGVDFGLPYGSDYTLAFSRLLYGREVLVAYNVSAQPRGDAVIVDRSLHADGERMRYLYGGAGEVVVTPVPGGAACVRLDLAGHQFVVLE
jgi:alpha amylase-like protein